MGRGGSYCGVLGCYNRWKKDTGVSVFALPSEPELRKKWLQHMGRLDENCWEISKACVCEIHFEKKYINFNSKRKRLMRAAIPTLFLGKKRFIPRSTSSGTNDASVIELLDEEQDDQQNKICNITEEPDSLTVLIDEEEEEQVEEEGQEEEQEGMLVANQVEFVAKFETLPDMKEKTRTQRYSTEFKMFALELYFKSPLSYRVLHSSFSLPRISTLYRLCIPQTTELSQFVLRALKIKADIMTQAQKQCVVCLGTMSIAPNIQYDAKLDKFTGFHEVNGVQNLEPARTALVVIVRGLFHNWKQTVAFSFLSNFQNYQHVTHYIDDIICRMFRVGLNVRALMTDLESDPFSATNETAFSSKQAFIEVDNKKIYIMYDPLRLMKNIRDKLNTHNFVFYNGLIANWQHVEECYNLDHKKELLRLAPKLTVHHIRPIKGDSHDELKLVTELFSNATASAISMYIECKSLPAAARDTVQWIITMKKLMEMLNFSSINPPEDKSAVFSGGTTQVDFLFSMLSLLSNLRLQPKSVHVSVDEIKHRNFIEAFKVTINNVLLLYGELKSEKCWFPVVGLTRDCLDEFFMKVRRKYDCDSPTTKQMTTCIKTFPIFNIFQYSCKRRDSSDLDTFISNTRQMPDVDMYEQKPCEEYVDVCADDSTEFRNVDLPKHNKLENLAFYLLHKGFQKHNDCNDMRNYACTNNRSKEGSSETTDHANYDGELNEALPLEFIDFILELEVKFKEYFKQHRLTRSISGLLGFIRKVKFDKPCECFPLDYIKHLYLRFRVYLVVKFNNESFRRSKTGKHVFAVNNL